MKDGRISIFSDIRSRAARGKSARSWDAKAASSESARSAGAGALNALATAIVNGRYVIFALFALACVYCALSVGRVQLETTLTAFLPESTETRQGIAVMDEEFTTYATADVMVSNVTYDMATELAQRIEQVPHVADVALDDSPTHFAHASALLQVSFDNVSQDAATQAAMDAVRDLAASYDSYISTSIGRNYTAQLAQEMVGVVALAALVIVLILLLTSRSYFEVAISVVVFAVAALLNMGTNFLLGKISSISNSVAVILQLALAIDYAIILSHRYQDARSQAQRKAVGAADAHAADKRAIIGALAAAIPEILSSSLTTVSGLFALMLMHFGLGPDLGAVLAKGILCSLVSVFFLMPGLILCSSRLLAKTAHKPLLPSIEGWGRFLGNSKSCFVWAFALLVPVAFFCSSQTTWAFNDSSVSSLIYSESRYATQKIVNTFDEATSIAVIVPQGSYASEKALLEDVSALPGIKSATGLANISVGQGDAVLTDSFTPRKLSELLDIDIEQATLLLQGYGIEHDQYQGIFGNASTYSVPLIDLFDYLFKKMDQGVVTLSGARAQDVADLRETLRRATDQLQGTEHDRMVMTATVPVESAESTQLVDTIRQLGEGYYGEGNVLVTGEITSARDLADSFQADSMLISVLTALFVFLILLFTFKSWVAAFIMVLVIQGAIWINFSFPYVTHFTSSFVTYMICSAIQMGATIDYAIVIMNRYRQARAQLAPRPAMTRAVADAFPTVLTSGAIMALAGLLIAYRVSDVYVGHIGLGVGRGALISVALVLTVLPQLIVLLDGRIEKTRFTLPRVFGKGSGARGTSEAGELRSEAAQPSLRPLAPDAPAAAPDAPAAAPDAPAAAKGPRQKGAKHARGTLSMLAALALAVGIACAPAFMPGAGGVQRAWAAESEVHLTCAADLQKLAADCSVDSYSRGLAVYLDASFDLAGQDFAGIPYFAGTFYGNGHEITGLSFEKAGDHQGFFRYVAQGAQVCDLRVAGTLAPADASQAVGGVAGVNRGVLSDCVFSGTVRAESSAGGICGENEGSVQGCSVEDATVEGRHQVGGVCGKNTGTLTGCTSKALVNTTAVADTLAKKSYSLSALVKNATGFSEDDVLDITDVGGVCGKNAGVLEDCTNHTQVGYAHMGYNVGGICGMNSAIVRSSTNYGAVYGRRDVGGVVGQQEPFTQWDVSAGKLDDVQQSFAALNASLSQALSGVGGSSAQARAQANELAKYLQEAFDQLKQIAGGNADTGSSGGEGAGDSSAGDGAGSGDAGAASGSGAGAGNAGSASGANSGNASGGGSNSGTGSADGASDAPGSADAAGARSFTGFVEAWANAQGAAAALRDTLSSGGDALISNMQDIVAYMDDFATSLAGAAQSAGDVDISRQDISTAQGKTSKSATLNSENSGEVQADANAGGIVGSIAFELSFDREEQLGINDALLSRARYLISAVVADCGNKGAVTAKKQAAGGIAGALSFGALLDCVAACPVDVSGGSYAGGVAGQAAGALARCFAQAQVEAASHAGGVAGAIESGGCMQACRAYAQLSCEGGACGALAGECAGQAADNYFVECGVGGIDGVSYEGQALPLSYAEMMSLDNTPALFSQIVVRFVNEEGQEVSAVEVDYGASVDALPLVASKEGKRWRWECGPDDLHDLRFSRTVKGSWGYPITALGAAYNEQGQPLVLAEGTFNDNQRLEIAPADAAALCAAQPASNAPVQEADVQYAATASVSDQADRLVLHVFAQAPAAAYVQGANGTLQKVESTQEGSYVVFSVPNGATFAVTRAAQAPSAAFIAGACLVAAAVLAAGGCRARRFARCGKKGREAVCEARGK